MSAQAQGDKQFCKLLAKSTGKYDSVLLTYSGPLLIGFGMKGDTCYKLEIDANLGIGGTKSVITRMSHKVETDAQVVKGVKAIPFSAILSLNDDSLNETPKESVVADGGTGLLYLIKSHKCYQKSSYAANPDPDLIQTADRKKFNEICGKLRRLYNGAAF